jgi:ferritin-like metal-binding protein YciE
MFPLTKVGIDVMAGATTSLPSTSHFHRYQLEEPAMIFHLKHIDNLRKLYVDQVEHLHSAETQITEALPNMIEKADDPELKRALQSHLQETREQVSRLEQILREATGKIEPKKNKPIAAMVSEAEDMLGDASNTAVTDAAIIAAGQRIEHYEIAAYGTVRDFAEIIGEQEHAALLAKTLEEEKNADATLSSISSSANTKADRAA